MKRCAGDSDWACNPRASLHNRAAKARVLLCALVMGTLLASAASAQYLEATIKLPDTLGPLNGPYHLAWDENPARPRLYIGGEGDSGGVIVAEALTCKRLARVSTGPAGALCFVPPHGKLYVASLDADSVIVVDCATNQITSAIYTTGIVPIMQYNAQNDRLYCGGDAITVIDCTGDTVTGTITLAASSFALDSATNKLYVGGDTPLAVVDCSTDSVIAAVPEVGSAIALCLNPTAAKVYAATVDTLFAVLTDEDSVVTRLPFDSLGPLLACDPQRNRIYCTSSDRDWGILTSIDCTADTVLKTTITVRPITFLACNIARDLLYIFFRTYYDEVFMYDGTTGQVLTSVVTHGVPRGGGWSPGLDRLYCLPYSSGDPGYEIGLLSAVDGTRDSVVGVVPLTVIAGAIALDTVHNRLYFTYGYTGCGCVGVVDCDQNVVTSYSYAGRYPTAPVYNPNNNRLYYTTWDGVKVYDCSTNTVRGRVTNATGYTYATRLHPSMNKLYAYASDTLGDKMVDVIDCEKDSVIKVLNLPVSGSLYEFLLVPEDNTLWCLNTRSAVVIDCTGDSILAVAPDTFGTITDACACPEDRRIYTGELGNTAWGVNMDGPDDVDTLHERIPEALEMHFVDIPGAHRAFWSYAYPSHWPGSSCVFVVDTRTNALVDSFWVGQMISDMCLDQTGDFVYCAALADSAVLVIDARGDSVVATVRLPSSMAASKNSLVMNRATNRIYVAQYDEYRYGDVIPAIRDSMLAGLEDVAPSGLPRHVGPSVVCRGMPLQAQATSDLWDATGRRVASLRVGSNDTRGLAAGIYFVREKPRAAGRKSQKTTKIVIVE